jgi:hypothetical protein
MRPTILWTLFVLLCATPAAAQVNSRWYLGATFGSNRVTNDDTDTGSVGAAGVTIGMRLNPIVSFEIDVNQGFGMLSRNEGLHLFAPPGSPREIRRFGVYQRLTGITPRPSRQGRLARPHAEQSLSPFVGVSGVWYRERHVITNLRILTASIEPPIALTITSIRAIAGAARRGHCRSPATESASLRD